MANSDSIARCPMQAVTLLLAGWMLGAAPPQTGPEPLPDDVVKAWKKAGAEVGWMGPDREGVLRFWEKHEGLDEKRTVPAFRLLVWREGMVAKLPAPARPFGLS